MLLRNRFLASYSRSHWLQTELTATWGAIVRNSVAVCSSFAFWICCSSFVERY